MRAAVLALVVAAAAAGCEAIDNFSRYAVGGTDGGGVMSDAVGGDVPQFDLESKSDLAPCGVCSPGDQRTIPCGNCGMETDTCTKACQWAAGACNGQGCAPGSTQAGGCDQCSQQTCGNNCQWSACALKPGNACEYRGGNYVESCNCNMQPMNLCTMIHIACEGPSQRRCLDTCQFMDCTCPCTSCGSVVSCVCS